MPIRREVRDGVFFRFTAPAQPLGTLLYVHGLGESGLCFEPLLRHPALGSWRQVAADLPGYGKSDWAPAPLRLKELADFIWRLSPQEAKLPTLLIGHSMGGVIGQLVCEAHPGDFQGFVNLEGNLSLEDCIFSLEAARCSAEDFSSRGLAQLADRVYHHGLSDTAQRGYYASIRICDPRAYHLNSRELVEMSESEDLARRLAALPLPALYLAGLRDRGDSRSVELLKESGARWEGWEDAGHWPFLDHTDRFAALVTEFVGALPKVG